MMARAAMKTIKRLGVGLGVAVLIAATAYVCLPAAMGTIIGLWDVPAKLNWRSRTSPLDPLVVQDICAKFALAADDARCEPGARVYTPDFFRDITREFREHDGVWSSFDDVEGKLGPYRIDLQPLVRVADGDSYFGARYDLKGDRIYPITFLFYEDGRVFRVIADVGD